MDDDAVGTGNDEYFIVDGEDIGWLGYYIGNNTTLHNLYFFHDIIDDEAFYKEISRNKYIQKLTFYQISFTGDIFKC